MRQIKAVSVTYADGTVEIFEGRGSASVVNTHDAPGDTAPSPGSDKHRVSYLSVNLVLTARRRLLKPAPTPAPVPHA